VISRGLSQLEGLRQRLQTKLEEELSRAEARWGENQFERLRQAAQRLADQLSEVEELESAIETQLQRRLEPGEGQ
jgi:DNA repair exonuclease SbcCD ATPase subunit